MATNRTGGSSATSKIAGSSSQQTNQQPDPQQTIELLQAYVQQDISARIEAMRPDIDEKIANLVAEAKEQVVKEIKESKTELQNVRNSVLGAVAVFAAFFTFVSVNVNIFSKSNAVESLALMIVMWICLMGFTYTFFLFLWDKWRDFRYWMPVVVGMAITCGVLWFVKPSVMSTPATSVEHGAK